MMFAGNKAIIDLPTNTVIRVRDMPPFTIVFTGTHFNVIVRNALLATFDSPGEAKSYCRAQRANILGAVEVMKFGLSNDDPIQYGSLTQVFFHRADMKTLVEVRTEHGQLEKWYKRYIYMKTPDTEKTMLTIATLYKKRDEATDTYDKQIDELKDTLKPMTTKDFEEVTGYKLAVSTSTSYYQAKEPDQ